MMKHIAWTIFVSALMLGGCAAERGTVVYSTRPDRSTANLALGPTADHTWLAETMTYRSPWPSVDAGYHYGDVTSYTQFIYDDQSHYDGRYGGGFTRESFSVRTGTVVR